MEKYGNIVKIEEVKRLAEARDYKKALEIIETIDVEEIKIATDLSTFAEVLTKNGRYKEAMEVLNKLYDKSISRRVVYGLLEVSIKSNNLNLANRYYKEYIDIAPKDPTRYIFQYLIYKLEGKSIKEQIIPLKDLKKYEYIEEWAYELATLYHKADMKIECISECNDIIIWFGSGDYVERAKLLKGYYEGEIDLFKLVKEKEEAKLLEQKEVEEKVEAERRKAEEEKKKDQELNNQLKSLFDHANIDYKDIFADFLNHNYIKEQIVESLIKIDNKETNFFNVVVTSNDTNSKYDKTSFSKAMLTALYKLGYISSNKVGIISGNEFNKIDLEKEKKTIKNCSIIIDNAPLLDDDKVKDIEKLFLDEEETYSIVLQGNHNKTRDFFEQNPNLTEYFSIKVEL